MLNRRSAKSKKKGQKWKKGNAYDPRQRTACVHTAPQRSLTASRGLWCIYAPSRCNPTTFPELNAPGQRQTTSKNNDASATVPPNYTKNWLVYLVKKTANLKIGVRYYLRLTHSCLASLKRWHPMNRDNLNINLGTYGFILLLGRTLADRPQCDFNFVHPSVTLVDCGAWPHRSTDWNCTNLTNEIFIYLLGTVLLPILC